MANGEGLNLRLPEEALTQIVGKAVIDALSDEDRNLIIAQAIAQMNKPNSTGGWNSDKRSPLQFAFDNAVANLVHKLVAEIVEESEQYAAIKAEVKAMLDRFPSVENDDELKTEIVNAVIRHTAEQARKGY